MQFLLQSTPSSLLQILLLIITALLALLSGLIIQERRARLDLRAQQDKQKTDEETAKEKERTAVRLDFLDPLLVSVKDYARRMKTIQTKLAGNAKEKTEMYDWFHNIKHPNQHSMVDFAYWCNGEGYFAVSTIYLAAVYFYQVNSVRREFPLNLLNRGEAERLLDTLAKARVTLGANYGIYTAIQDSVGDYLKSKDGGYARYRSFCEGLFKEEERAWLLNVIDYYRNLRDRKPDEVQRAIDSLDEVALVVESVSGLRREL